MRIPTIIAMLTIGEPLVELLSGLQDEMNAQYHKTGHDGAVAIHKMTNDCGDVMFVGISIKYCPKPDHLNVADTLVFASDVNDPELVALRAEAVAAGGQNLPPAMFN